MSGSREWRQGLGRAEEEREASLKRPPRPAPPRLAPPALIVQPIACLRSRRAQMQALRPRSRCCRLRCRPARPLPPAAASCSSRGLLGSATGLPAGSPWETPS